VTVVPRNGGGLRDISRKVIEKLDQVGCGSYTRSPAERAYSRASRAAQVRYIYDSAAGGLHIDTAEVYVAQSHAASKHARTSRIL
jgi:aryl-alcohol dehydrogenase-like predicted oxidoreductase